MAPSAPPRPKFLTSLTQARTLKPTGSISQPTSPTSPCLCHQANSPAPRARPRSFAYRPEEMSESGCSCPSHKCNTMCLSRVHAVPSCLDSQPHLDLQLHEDWLYPPKGLMVIGGCTGTQKLVAMRVLIRRTHSTCKSQSLPLWSKAGGKESQPSKDTHHTHSAHCNTPG